MYRKRLNIDKVPIIMHLWAILLIISCRRGQGFLPPLNGHGRGEITLPSVSRFLWYLGSKYQRLPPCFQGPKIQWSYSLYCLMQAEVINPRWWLTNNKYLGISQSVCNAIAAQFQRLYPFFWGWWSPLSYFPHNNLLFDTFKVSKNNTKVEININKI